jgi:hypothetical protein
MVRCLLAASLADGEMLITLLSWSLQVRCVSLDDRVVLG